MVFQTVPDAVFLLEPAHACNLQKAHLRPRNNRHVKVPCHFWQSVQSWVQHAPSCVAMHIGSDTQGTYSINARDLSSIVGMHGYGTKKHCLSSAPTPPVVLPAPLAPHRTIRTSNLPIVSTIPSNYHEDVTAIFHASFER